MVEVVEDRGSDVMEAYRAVGDNAIDIRKTIDDGQVRVKQEARKTLPIDGIPKRTEGMDRNLEVSLG